MLADELLQERLVDARADEGDVVLREDLVGVRLDVFVRHGVAGGREEGCTQSVPEGESVCEVQRQDGRVVVGSGGFALDQRGDALLEFVAGEPGRGNLGREKVDKVCSVRK